mmetsp:Transcript_96358/g.144237  ORF Transcript_96358/g.144237 Transcript_96358/m.144237 type:complete len:582 (-) Transcript_96358:29-1774(-)
MVSVGLPTASPSRLPFFDTAVFERIFGRARRHRLNKRRGTTPTRAFGRRQRLHKTRHFLICLTISISVSWILFYRCFAAPGRNMFDSGYWRHSHHSSPQIKAIQAAFPVHVEGNFELVDHPGFLLSEQEKLQVITDGMNISRSVRVPKFWDPPAYGENGVREFLGCSGKYLITREEAMAIGSFHRSQETIFVAVASYRDPECLPTVEDIFLRAKHPERIRVGIIDQISEGDTPCNQPVEPCEQNPDQILCKYGHLVESVEYPARFMVGPTFARHIANRLYRGEYFSMQVDSHVRFVADWDDDIIRQWKSIGNEMAVITNYMSDIEGSIDPTSHESLRETRSMMCKVEFEWPGDSKEHIKYMIQPNNKPRIENTPMLQPFWAAGLSFARGHFTVQVPYDPYLPMVFQGEEISMSVRAFSFGYDFYAPTRHVAFHIYAIRKNLETRRKVSKFSENEVIFPGAKKAGYVRLNGIIGPSDASKGYNSIEEGKYGVGQVRSTDKFYRTFGIDVISHQLQDDLCDFVQGTGGIQPMHLKFSPFLRYDSLGIDYSRIAYEHKPIVLTETSVDEKELAALRARLRKRTT